MGQLLSNILHLFKWYGGDEIGGDGDGRQFCIACKEFETNVAITRVCNFRLMQLKKAGEKAH